MKFFISDYVTARIINVFEAKMIDKNFKYDCKYWFRFFFLSQAVSFQACEQYMIDYIVIETMLNLHPLRFFPKK